MFVLPRPRKDTQELRAWQGLHQLARIAWTQSTDCYKDCINLFAGFGPSVKVRTLRSPESMGKEQAMANAGSLLTLLE